MMVMSPPRWALAGEDFSNLDFLKCATFLAPIQMFVTQGMFLGLNLHESRKQLVENVSALA